MPGCVGAMSTINTYLGSVHIGALTTITFTKTETFKTSFVILFLYVKRALFAQITRLTIDISFTKTFRSVLQ